MTAVIALIAAPMIGLLGGAAFLLLAGGFEGFITLLHEGGFTTYLSLAAGVLGAIGIGVSSFFLAKRTRVPLAMLAVAAILPWAIGLLGMIVGLGMVESALAVVDPQDARRIFVVGVSECYSARVVGTFVSAVLLFGMATSLLAASLGAREQRSRLLTGAALAAAGALFALADVLTVRALSQAMSATASIAASDMAALVAAALSELSIWKTALIGAGALLAAASLAHLAIARSADAVILVVFLAAIIGLDLLGTHSVYRAGERMAFAPLASAEFEPAPAPRTDSGGRVEQIIGRGKEPSFSSPAGGYGIALDRRIASEETLRIAAAFQTAGGKQLLLFGEERLFPETMFDALGDDAILFRPISHRQTSVEVLVGVDASQDPDLQSAEVTGGDTLAVKGKDGAVVDGPGGGKHLFLIMGEQATAGDLVRAADEATKREYRPVLLRELPPIEMQGTETAPPGRRTPGSLASDAIRRVIQRNLGKIKVCYERELGRNPSLQGKVNVSFTIEPNGRVSRAEVADTTIGDKSVEGCIAQTVKRLRFPRPAGGYVDVKYPFVFLPH